MDRAESERQISLMRRLHHCEMRFERRHDPVRQDRASVLAALSFAHRNLPNGEIDILDPQAQALHQAQSRAVEQRAHDPLDTLEMREQPLDLILGQDDRKLVGPLRAHQAVDPARVVT